MKKWLETRQVLDRLVEIQRGGKRAALATVVRVRGSAYRHEGAKMLIAEDGTTTGNVSGGCLEADVREVALQVIATGQPQSREYCGSADEIAAWDLGVGCEGVVDVLVDLVDSRVEIVSSKWQIAIDKVRELLDSFERFVWCSVADATRPRGMLVVSSSSADGDLGAPALNSRAAARARELLDGGASGIHDIDGVPVFFDVFAPPPQLLIVSGGDDAQYVARAGAGIGFRVTVADRRPGLLVAERFPPKTRLSETDAEHLSRRVAIDDETYAVVMTHNYADDREYVRALLGTRAAYIGMLGPRQRTDRILAELGATGTIDDSRVYGPVGLDIGTDGAEQVALAVVAEILAVRSGRRPASLRERRAPIHADAE